MKHRKHKALSKNGIFLPKNKQEIENYARNEENNAKLICNN